MSADEQRARMADTWERAAEGWGRQADRVRDRGMPVSNWMIEHLALQPGQRVLELAAGPGDTGFLAAELIRPGGGVLVCTDASEAMLELARGRAAEQGIDNIEFRQLQLEWIDLETAAVDAILCRWALMLCVDPDAALRECRRVLRPGGRIALAVWDRPERNPWTTLLSGAVAEIGAGQSPPAGGGGPGMFALSDAAGLAARLEEAGFMEPVVEPVSLEHRYPSLDAWIAETLDCSMMFRTAWSGLSEEERGELASRVGARVTPYVTPGGALALPGSALCAAAEA